MAEARVMMMYTTEAPTYTRERFSMRRNRDRQQMSAMNIMMMASTSTASAFPWE